MSTNSTKSHATRTLIALLVLWALVQWFVFGVDISKPSNADLLRFGVQGLPLALIEPWRLASAVFLHIGLLHLLFNCVALDSLGRPIEHIFGKTVFLSIFLTSALLGNVAHLYYHFWLGTPSLAAGASGGVMGLGGALCVALWQLERTMPKDLAIMLVANIALGFVIDGLDNAAHIGGLSAGVLLGFMLNAPTRKRLYGACIAMLILAVLAFYALYTQSRNIIHSML